MRFLITLVFLTSVFSTSHAEDINLRLAGIVFAGETPFSIIIEDKITGKQKIYGLNDTVEGNRIKEISEGVVVLEREGKRFILTLKRGYVTEMASVNTTEKDNPISKIVSFSPAGSPWQVKTEELPFYEPVNMGPPEVPVKELPVFNVVENRPPDVETQELPSFTPHLVEKK